MHFLTTALRRLAALIALVLGVLLATSLAVLTFAMAASIGIVLWLAARLGARRIPPGAARTPDRPSTVIDVEMREIEPGPKDAAAPSRDDRSIADRPGAGGQ